ncbi:MAG: hypothetical protein R3B54_01470 [Bdellovibrionota bacterium]
MKISIETRDIPRAVWVVFIPLFFFSLLLAVQALQQPNVVSFVLGGFAFALSITFLIGRRSWPWFVMAAECASWIFYLPAAVVGSVRIYLDSGQTEPVLAVVFSTLVALAAVGVLRLLNGKEVKDYCGVSGLNKRTLWIAVLTGAIALHFLQRWLVGLL